MTSKKRVTACILLLALLSPLVMVAQTLPQQNQEILNELKAIRQLLEKLAGPLNQGNTNTAPPDENVKLSNVTGPVLGQPDAPLTMVEFTDLQCPFCRQFHVTTFEQIKRDYIDTGKLRYISRDFPLDALHPLAVNAAQAAHCAGDQGKFWDMRHTILVNNAQLDAKIFSTLAQDMKLNPTTFATCMADRSRFQADIQKDLSDGSSVGVSGTPSFVIGLTAASGLDGVRIVGAQPYSVFDAKLKELLAKTSR